MARRRWSSNFILAAGLVLATGAIPAAGSEPDHEIRLLGQRFTPPPGVPETARQAIGRRAEELRAQGKERLHLLVQLHELPSPAGRQELARQGLDLGAFVPGSAFIAAVPVGRAVAAVARPEVRWATLWDAGHKLHPRIAAGDWAPWTRDPARPERVAVMLLLHHDVPLAAGPALAENVGGVAMPAIEGLHGMIVWLPPDRVAELAAEEEVLWIEEAPPPLTPTNDGVRSGLRAGGLADAPYGLTGSGVRLFVFDDGTVRRTHQTFDPGTGSQVTLIDDTPMSSHATHVAGTAAGDGSGSTGDRGRGVAPGVSLLSAGYQQTAGTMLFWDNAGDIEADYARARNTHQADLGTNSIGSNTAQNGYPCEREGDYGVSSSLLDSIVLGTNPAVGSPVLMTWAAGNERNAGDIPGRCGSNYGTTAPPACAKNPLHVGAVNSDGLAMTEFSSWGPCDDGRLKPTLVAPGCETGLVTGETGVFSSTAASDSAYDSDCGTSMATPAVAGAASLLTQAWRQKGLGGPTERPSPALIKALLIHTARDLGPEGPDYVYGYGAVDAKAAIDLLRGDNSFTRGWLTGTVGQDVIREHCFNGPWEDLDEAKVTLVWDDPAAAPFAAEALVNDLSLEYTGYPYTTNHRPWVLAPASPHLPASTGVDSRNNVEQIVVRDAPPSDTLMRVIGARVPQGPQSYALVYSFNSVVVDKTSCTATNSTFETGNDGWTLAGAARTLAPASGHGATSVRLGGSVDTFHQATRAVAVPSEARAELTFWWYMTTEESLDLFGFGFDPFTVEIRNSSGAVLAVVDLRNDGWPQGRWIQHPIDLTPWAGQTVTIAFTATNDFEAATTFWIDDVTVTSCPKILNTGGSTAAVSVTPVDDPPTAVNDAATVGEDSGANAINVLANDTDPDGGAISIISVTQPANGTVAITGCGTGLIYAPNANYCNNPPGTTLDTFTYTLTPGGSSTTVTVTVTCADDPPVAVADSATVAEDSGANAISVLANDTDPDAGPISITSVTQPANGAVVITGGGTGLTYAPNASYCNPPGTTLERFNYALAPGGSSTTVTMTVTCVSNRNVGATAATASLGYQGGPQIAVNPNNANQIVAVADTDWAAITQQCEEPVAVFSSGDGGTTWQAACAPGLTAFTNIGLKSGGCFDTFFSSDPVVAWDDANRVFLSYTWACSGRSSLGGAVVSARSTDGGATWTAHSIVADGFDLTFGFGSLEEKNAYAIDNNPASPFHGRHYTCWDSFNDEKFAWSTDGGASWSPVDLPVSPNGGYDLDCEMAVEDNGTVHLVFEPSVCLNGVCSDASAYTRSTDGGATWSSPVLVRNFNLVRGSGAHCPLAQDQRCIRAFGPIAVDNSGGACDGHLYVAFTDHAAGGDVNHSDVFLSKSVDGGATWSSPVQVNDDGLPNRVQFHPFLEVDPSNGHVVVAWHDARNHVVNDALDIFAARSTNCGASFGANVQVSQPSAEFNNSGISWSNHNSLANPGYGWGQTGDHLGLDVRNGKAYVAWTDTRHYFPSFTTEPQKDNIGFSIVDFAGGASSVCGNNLREAGEACDGADLGGQTCQGLTFTNGTLACKANCSFDTAGCHVTFTTTTFTSVAAEDGYILESGEFTSAGGNANSTDNSASAILAGDDHKKNQYRSVLSFDTSAVPDGAAIQSVTLRLRRGTVAGANPFTTHGSLRADLRNGAFNGNAALETTDFQAAATVGAVCALSNAANNGDWSECTFSTAGLAALNKAGKTQIRIAFSTDDDNDSGDDYIGYYSSNNATAANHPQLIVTYQ